MGELRPPYLSALRAKTPYVNYTSGRFYTGLRLPSDHALPGARSAALSTSPEVPTARVRWKYHRSGFGSRHIDDQAPFSLWNEEEGSFRNASKDEMQWVFDRYDATVVKVRFPIIIIGTAQPPNPAPLTVGCVATLFVPPETEQFGPNLAPNTSYASPRIPDPINAFRLKEWRTPTPSQKRDIFMALEAVANVKAVVFMSPFIFVELHVDGRTYDVRSLPGRVAGRTTLYHHSNNPFIKHATNLSRSRLIDAGSELQDTSNYARTTLSPGVRVESSLVTDEGPYATISASTTAGVRVRDEDGNVRITVSNHGFMHSDQVYHPTSSGILLGSIDERFVAQDIALVQLNPSIRFTNESYFEATPPKRLLRSSDIQEGRWYSADGMSTGLLFFFSMGQVVRRVVWPPGFEIPHNEFRTETIYQSIGPLGGTAQNGVCGAPLVEEDADFGGVAGFYQLGNQDLAVTPCLDEFIDRGWTLW